MELDGKVVCGGEWPDVVKCEVRGATAKPPVGKATLSFLRAPPENPAEIAA